jgi:hypothetical protein
MYVCISGLDGSDEVDCEYCGGRRDEVKCPFSDKCIPASKWCDGMRFKTTSTHMSNIYLVERLLFSKN